MSRLPKVDKKPKNNKDNKFRWVDSQWEKFMDRHDEDIRIIDQLREDLITCNKYFQKQRKDILQLEMENAELKDMVLDLGGEYKEDEGDNQLSFDFEVADDKGNGDFEVK